MERAASEYIQMCQWDSTKFLIFSDNVFGNLIYYSHLLPLIVSLLFTLFIFFKNPKLLSGRWLLITTILLSVWLFFDLILWATEKPSFTMFFWSIINMVEPMIYAGILFFMYAFIDGRSISFKQKLIVFTLLLPTVVLASTSLNLSVYDLSNCWREALEGPLPYYSYAIEIIFTLWILIFGVKRFFQLKNKEGKKKIILVTAGAVFFLLSFSMGNVIGSLLIDWEIGQYGLFGMPVFIGLLAYMVVKYRTFNIKLIATQALVWGLVILQGSQFFFIKTPTNFILNGVGFLGIIIAGYLVVKSVKTEIEQKEKLQIISEQLFEANEKLKSLDKLKTEFLSLAAHQLRSPLTAIKGYASMILDGDYGEINPKAKESVDRIFLSSQNLTKVVEDLLNVAKIEQGGMKFEMAPFNLAEVVGDMVKDLSVVAEKRGLKLTFESDKEEDVIVNGDKEKIRQVVLNLIDNSIKYTNEGSIDVSIRNKDGKVIFAVKDTGMGMTPETKASLFQKFARGEGAKMNTSGSGLGLYLAKEITEAHNGRVWVESEGLGKGSTFYMELDVIK